VSQEQVLKTLTGLGLSKLDSQTYIYLAKKGPLKGAELTKGLKMQKQLLYRSLKNLQSKGLVNVTLEYPARFMTLPFDKVIDVFVSAKMTEAQAIQHRKEDILAIWQTISVDEKIDASPKFSVLEGRKYIYSRIREIIKQSKTEVATISTVAGLVRADSSGLFDNELEHSTNLIRKLRFLTELSKENMPIIKKLLPNMNASGFIFEGRTPNIGLGPFPEMLIRDDEEALFFITAKNDPRVSEEESCLWTDCKPLVQAFKTLFEDLWRNGTKIQEKMGESQTEKKRNTHNATKFSEITQGKYEQELESAEHEILMVSAFKGTYELAGNKQLLVGWKKKGIKTRILAPITIENIEVARDLTKYAELRHSAAEIPQTTLVDGSCVFQLKEVSNNQNKTWLQSNDLEFIQKTLTTLNNLWKNARAPSMITLDSIVGRSVTLNSDDIVYRATKKMLGHEVTEDEDTRKELTEQTVMEKMFRGEKNQDETEQGIVTMFTTNAQAIIHPPSNLNLPEILIHSYHLDKKSTFGTEDALMIFLWLPMPTGSVFVPTTVVTDNPRSVEWWRKSLGRSPAENNIFLVKKDELHITVFGNTVFAGWTVQIPLIEKYSLPPACMVIEGYGDIKTRAYKASTPAGYTMKVEGNNCPAFVNFLHSDSNYSGSGTDGAIGREVIIKVYPPN